MPNPRPAPPLRPRLRLTLGLTLWAAVAALGCDANPSSARPQPSPPPAPSPDLTPDLPATPSAPAVAGAPSPPPPLPWRQDAAQALRDALVEGKPALVDFWAAWCQPCVRLDHETFADPRVREALGRFVIVRVDATQPDAATQALTSAYKVSGYPTLLLIDSQGLPSRRYRYERFVRAEELLFALSQVR